MPSACPWDAYVLSYCSEERNDPPGKPVALRRGSFAAIPCSEERNDPPGKPVAFKMASRLSSVARNVTIHRASRWHSRGSFAAVPCSEERNDPPGKPVAFKR